MSHPSPSPPPPQGYSVELYFDPALENQVLKAWNVLARRQISTHLIEMESRPHITLLSSPTLDPVRLQAALRSFASRHEPLSLSLSSVAAFPSNPSPSSSSSSAPPQSDSQGNGSTAGIVNSSNNNVLFLAPTPSMGLLQFHSQLCDALKKEGVEIGEEYRPDSWVPYCSVAQDVPKNRMAEAFCILRELKLPVSGYAMDIALVEFSPVREIFSFPLGSVTEA